MKIKWWTNKAALFGLQWLEHIKLNWQKVCCMRGSVSGVVEKHTEVIGEGLGILKGTTAKIYVVIRELCTTGITLVWFIPSVDTDMCFQTTTLWELCTTCFTLNCKVYPPCGYENVSSNGHIVRIVHHMCHTCMVYLPCKLCTTCITFTWVIRTVDTDMFLHTTILWELGTLKGTTGKIYVVSNQPPKFYKPRSVP